MICQRLVNRLQTFVQTQKTEQRLFRRTGSNHPVNTQMHKRQPNILIDAREFVNRRTGIGRFLEGLTTALCASELKPVITLGMLKGVRPPAALAARSNVSVAELSPNYFVAEAQLAVKSRNHALLYISPYPKLPLMGCGGKAVHTVHDVLDLTHAPHRGWLKKYRDRCRLKLALQRADLTWFVSAWSKKKTEELLGTSGRNPKVRHNGIDSRFSAFADAEDVRKRRRYGLEDGYVLVIGNGRPHKNLGILLSVAKRMGRTLIFAGMSNCWKNHWRRKYPKAPAIWIEYASDEEMPALIRGAHCLALPSLEEGFGYPPLEAMASGVPAVVSRIPALIETTGGNALMADPGSAEEWLQAFRCLEDQNCYRTYVQKGMTWARQIQGIDGWRGHIDDIAKLL